MIALTNPTSVKWGVPFIPNRLKVKFFRRIAGYFARRTRWVPDAYSSAPQVLSSSSYSSLDCRAGRGRPFSPRRGQIFSAGDVDETHSRADGLLMDSSTRRWQGDEGPPEGGGDSFETRRTIVGKANVARISFLKSLNGDLLRLPARCSDVVKIISSAGWPSQRMLPVPQRC